MGQELGHLAQRLNGGLKGIRVKTHVRFRLPFLRRPPRYRLDALGVAEKHPAQEVVGIGASRVYWLRDPRALPWQSEGGSA
jgi:hypothetical protein